MVNDSLLIEEPTVADLAAGVRRQLPLAVLDEEGADVWPLPSLLTMEGGTITKAIGEQKFCCWRFTVYHSVGDIRFEPSRNLDHTGGDIAEVDSRNFRDSDSDLVSTVTPTITDGALSNHWW